MKTLGLIGGMSWTSTAVYYRRLNELVAEIHGELHSARCIVNSLNMQDIAAMQTEGRWEEAANTLSAAAVSLETAGAEAIVLCTNTMHKVAEAVQRSTALPFLHIVDPTAEAIKSAGLKRIALIGTRFTMQDSFFRTRLMESHGIEALVPEANDQALVHRIIFEELCKGLVHDASRKASAGVVARLEDAGAEGLILGCTELTLLIGQGDLALPVFDTTELHVRHALAFALDSAQPAR